MEGRERRWTVNNWGPGEVLVNDGAGYFSYACPTSTSIYFYNDARQIGLGTSPNDNDLGLWTWSPVELPKDYDVEVFLHFGEPIFKFVQWEETRQDEMVAQGLGKG